MYIIAGIFLPYVIIYSIPVYLYYISIFWEEKIIENLILLYSNTKKVVAVSFSLVLSVLFSLNFISVFFAYFFFDTCPTTFF